MGKMKYTKKRRKIIYDAIAGGLSQKDAAKLSGLDEDTITRWKKKYPAFADKLEQKEIEFKQEQVNIIRSVGLKGTWQAAGWLLERKFNNEFARRIIEEGTHKHTFSWDKVRQEVMKNVREGNKKSE